MDRPDLNHATLRKVEIDLIDFKYIHTLLDIGTCGLQTIHNDFQISTQVSNKKNPNTLGGR